MNRYLLTSTVFTGEIEYRFDATGTLSYFENRSEINQQYLEALIKVFPFKEDRLIRMAGQSQTMTLARIAYQITFDEFWNAYGYKVGNKARARKLWEALTDTERVLVMQHLPKYEAYLASRPRMEKLYPETYLSQRRWESEFPVK